MYDVLRQWGYIIPNDISVIRSGDILVSGYFDIPLTTIRYDFDDMMDVMTTKLIEFIREPHVDLIAVDYAPDLVVRQSCSRIV